MQAQAQCMWKNILLLAGTAGWLTGCATESGNPSGSRYVFYPPPPAPPRIQFLTSISSGKDPQAVSDKLVEFVVGAQTANIPILKPYGLSVVSNQLFVCDTGNRAIDIFDLEQQTLQMFSPAGMGKLGVPINIAFDTDGARFVTDTARNQVLCYDAAGQYSGMLDETNSIRPTGVAVTSDRLYVSDINTHCVRVYSKPTRQLLFTIPQNPEAAEDVEPGKLYMPVNLALDEQGRIYVSDLSVCRVKIFEPDGKFLRTLGGQGDLPGQFARPKGIAVDRAGRIFVVDAASQTCSIFDAEGRLLLAFGEPDSGAGDNSGTLNLPAAVCIDYAHATAFQKHVAPGFVLEEIILISNQVGAHKISVFGLGHKE